jgi:hypothetical protein
MAHALTASLHCGTPPGCSQGGSLNQTWTAAGGSFCD